MPPKGASRKRAAADEDEDDGGFVEDAPKSKKSKQNGGGKVASGKQKDEAGNEYWELSRTRRVQLSEFKGATMISIREFYEKDDKMLPGKKGISLSVEQFKAVVEMLPDIEESLSAKGITMPRPHYGGEAGADASPEDPAEYEEKEEDEAAESSKGRLEKYKMGKGNHEATSDEEE